jgi:3-oxoadipate enol-lactonase
MSEVLADGGAPSTRIDPARPHPPLPPGREVHLPGRGTTFVRELPGPYPGAPVVMLLHGWTATADLNFFAAYEALGQHFRVIALDHRGHGRGIRTRRTFKLADCADDAACLAAELGVDRFVPIGYSMGGPIAMLLWRRHATAVAGLVLCATAAQFSHTRAERVSFLGLTGLGALARLTPMQAQQWVTDQVYLRRKVEQWDPWAIEQATRHDWRMVLEAGRAIGSFSARPWLGEIDVPTSVVLTMRDPVVPISRQIRLAEAIPQARTYRVDGEHDAIVSVADRMVPTIVEATHRVLVESRLAGQPTP